MGYFDLREEEPVQHVTQSLAGDRQTARSWHQPNAKTLCFLSPSSPRVLGGAPCPIQPAHGLARKFLRKQRDSPVSPSSVTSLRRVSRVRGRVERGNAPQEEKGAERWIPTP